MARWLVKEEPSHYSFEQFRRDGSTEWSGVHNALALRNLKAMRPGDEGLYYHTGSEKAVVGTWRVVSVPRPDPSDDRGSWTVKIRPDRPLEAPVTLSQMRADAAFAGFDLLRISRLSVVSVPEPIWRRVLALGFPAGHSGQRPRRKKAVARARSAGST